MSSSATSGSARVAVLQATGVVGAAEKNLTTVASAARDAAGAGAHLLVTPELFVSGYDPRAVADDDGAAHRDRLAGIARDAGIALVASTVEAVEGGARRHICASFVDETGREVTRYRKSFLFGPDEEAVFTPGRSAPEPFVFRGLTLALGICFDVEFPEFTREVTRRDVHLLCVPTAVPVAEPGMRSDPHRIPELVVPTRALESGLFIAYANHHGPGFTGSSSLSDPFGAQVAAASRDEAELLLADASREASERARAETPYGEIVRSSAWPA